jgi:hypothetical protein
MRLLMCGLLASLALSADVTGVTAVYLLPMAGGLDQYLANRLTGGQVFRVVTDPKLADAIFTDHLGDAFEKQLTDLYPPPEATDKEEDDNKPQPHPSAFGRGKGTIFLVDLKSRAVIWSGYEGRIGSKPELLDRTAVRIVQQIKKQQKGKQ